jgi:hypothetical protein
MSLEAVRLVADYLDNADTGVNAILALADFPLDSGDAAPAAVTVYDATRDGWVARMTAPRASQGVTYPCLTVRATRQSYHPERKLESEGGKSIAGEVTVVIEYIVRLVDSEEAVEDASYVMRAILGSLCAFNDAALEVRTRNGVTLDDCTAIERSDVAAPYEDVVALATLALTYTTRESTP